MQETITKLLVPACGVTIIVQVMKAIAPKVVCGGRATVLVLFQSAAFTWLWIHNLWTPEGLACTVLIAAAAAGIHGTARDLWPRKVKKVQNPNLAVMPANPLNSTPHDPQLRLGRWPNDRQN